MKKLLCLCMFALSLGAIPAAGSMDIVPIAHVSNCVAKDNLGEKVRSFISRCRKASINREFPSEMLDKSLEEMKKGSSSAHHKAWKLLNDSRFAK